MSLRLRLFLGLAGLVAVMVTVQWWWVGALTRDLSDEVRFVAFEVGHSMASLLTDDPEEKPSPPVFDFVVATPQTGPRKVVTIHPDDPEKGHHHTGERREAWVGVQKGDQPPSWIQLPKDAESVHWISADDGEEPPVRKFKLRRSFGAATDDQHHEIIVGLDMDAGKDGDDTEKAADEGGENSWFGRNFFFSDDNTVQSGYITVLATGDDSSRRIPIPDEGLNDKLENFRRRMLWGSLAIFGIGLVLSAFVAQRVSAPLRRLAEAAREVGEGSLGKQVPVSASGEVGQAIGAFNRMSSELESYDRKTRQLRARQHLGEIGEIARGLAHTLRNPLNALGLSVEELAVQAPDEAASLAGSARRQIRRIDHSIRSFLALASQGGGVISEVAPGELVQDVALEALQDGRRPGSIEEGGQVRLDVDVDTEVPALRAVEPELRAVLQALVVNAVEASPEGGTVSIRVRPDDTGDRVRVEIEDEGQGLPTEVRERLFTPHLTTKANGSGMGLFLAHRIATTRYDGRLEIEDAGSVPLGGTRGGNTAGGGTRAVLEIGPRNQELDHG